LILSAVLSILKIIGLICLWILAVILALILLVLFVPVRYSGEVCYPGEKRADITAGWLLNFVRVHFYYDSSAHAEAKVFLFRVWSLRNEKSGSEVKNEPASVPEMKPQEPEKKTEPKPEEKSGQETESEAIREMKTGTSDLSGDEAPTEESGPEQGKIYRGVVIQKETGTEQDSAAAEKNVRKKRKIGLPDKIRRTADQIRTAWNKIADKRKTLTSFLEDEKNRILFGFLWKRLKRILKGVLPKKIDGTVQFGFEDPYTTGQVLSYAALLLPLYHDKLKLIPVFEQKIFTADVAFKGRIYLITLVFTGLEIWFNRDLRRLYRKVNGGSRNGRK